MKEKKAATIASCRVNPKTTQDCLILKIILKEISFDKHVYEKHAQHGSGLRGRVLSNQGKQMHAEPADMP